MNDIEISPSELLRRSCCDGLCGALDCQACRGSDAEQYIREEKLEELRLTCEHLEAGYGEDVCPTCGMEIEATS